MNPPLRILVADDDAEMRAWLALALRPMACELEQLDDGHGLLDRIAAEAPFDVVITDVRMPGPNGINVVAMARTAGLAVPFLVITAFPSPEVSRIVHGMEHTALLAKPFEADELRTILSELIARAHVTHRCASSPSSSSR